MHSSRSWGFSSATWVYLTGVYLTGSRFLGDRRAVTALEYAIIAGCMVAVIIATMSHGGLNIAPTFNAVAAEL